jgi:hypothetical protein
MFLAKLAVHELMLSSAGIVAALTCDMPVELSDSYSIPASMKLENQALRF